MRITAHNVQSVLGVYPERLPDVLPQVFSTLLEPDVDELILQNYTGAIKQRFQQDERPRGQVKFDSFGEAAFEAGIVKTMLTVTQNTRPGIPCAIAAYQALDSMWHMMRTGNTAERRALLEELIEHDAIEICLNKAMNHPLCIHRSLGANLLWCFAAESFLGDVLGSAKASEIMVKMCQYTLTGPQFYIDQMGSPATTWQSCMCFGNHSTSAAKAARYAPRYYAMSQESAIWTIHGLLCRSPPPSQQFCYKILSQDPTLIDLLFEVAVLKRPPWYPESRVDSLACEVLALLFRVSPDSVPGVPVTIGDELQEEIEAEYKALVDSYKLLTSRPKWAEKIIGVWNRIDDEKRQDIKAMITRVGTDYLAQTDVDQEAFLGIFKYRGASRICMLRLIATLTHVASECNVSDAELVSFLRIGNAASQNIKTMQQLSTGADQCIWIERVFELFRSPLYTVFTLDQVDPPGQVSDESIMGPTALIRLLAVLAQRGVLASIEKWTKLPEGTSPSTTLAQAKQFTSAEFLRHSLLLGVKRVTGRREVGHKRIRENNEMPYAGFAYSTAAELAAALVAFDRATKGKYGDNIRGARKELVLCLGNASEMALGLGQYRRGLNFALGAVNAAVNLPASDAVDESVVAKNKRRADRGRLGQVAS